ncbi:M48 family metallopeptidase [Curvibacter sp. CHRR-16]|uniref:M48 family metallopeptidase n=1 Tax=Curvibacter sp. CHRR-16 TaxID=2835872 RepID=UPI001BD982B0|nr:M48 family metallopeptidase [Curvibacter sp. CHRR-16]MBT0571023.1 M48 family metallopeptidase [Curvibacter sp. CHRR-16]
MQASAPASLPAQYFDGLHAKPHAVRIHLQGQRAEQTLHIVGENLSLHYPVHQIGWPERSGQHTRCAELPQGGQLQCADAVAWDAWSQAHLQARETLPQRLIASWHWVSACAIVLFLLGAGLYQWGIPLFAQAVAAWAPPELEKALGEHTLAALENSLLQPSQIDTTVQARIEEDFGRLVQALPAAQRPAWKLRFYSSDMGPNALALPDGTIIVTDAMVELVQTNPPILSAVLAHELGHVHHHHGLRMVVQATAIGAIGSLLLGDFSSLVAAVPVLMGQAHYSRSAEREADAYAVDLLRQGGRSPLLMVQMFEALAAAKPEREQQMAWLGLAFSSHPSDAERIAFFRQSAM